MFWSELFNQFPSLWMCCCPNVVWLLLLLPLLCYGCDACTPTDDVEHLIVICFRWLNDLYKLNKWQFAQMLLEHGTIMGAEWEKKGAFCSGCGNFMGERFISVHSFLWDKNIQIWLHSSPSRVHNTFRSKKKEMPKFIWFQIFVAACHELTKNIAAPVPQSGTAVTLEMDQRWKSEIFY